jgi:lipid II:glycine glycyltransferase (peptidoglycan interpeptide bridge formation enzyme)
MGMAQLDLMGAGRPDEQYGVRDFKAEFGGEMVEYGRYVYAHRSLMYKMGTRLIENKFHKKWK